MAASPLEEALHALRDRWAEVSGLLDEADRTRLTMMIRRYRAAAPEDRIDVALDLAMWLGETLPPDHPVRRALAQGDAGTRTAGTAERTRDMRADLDDLVAELHRHIVSGEAKERLLAFPCFTAAELRERGQDPADRGLVRLTDLDGAQRLPEFQFDENGKPRPVVVRINEILGADTDPWGTASWWLDRNARFEEAPFRLLGRMPDEDLVAAATAVVEDGD